ncbi:diacylglycerol kinase family enzyme [Kineococcus xinjiangensis]|uniref:Diacylglycerol kinase family enzyme n=1 Tax=Kineococcus xinjiangensis TaxID=512762 RepID=A0A2S6IK52_9ACTN|nr:diacylglycerol kinase family protein [Kineococcus xinjiangensis]PPK94612.1 diacylglycerol kinase family enzyme [Kineococcus xinjiangensis]
MSTNFGRVVIVFNPNSTGDGPGNARELCEQLSERLPGTAVELSETQHAGHAEQLAEEAIAQNPATLVVSASGDGGYHEVVNGVMRARRRSPGAGVAAVLASGNANDHANAVQHRPLVDAVVAGAVSPMDLLEVSTPGKEPRYAHSYVGLGITPVAAAELNQHDLDAVKETLLVVRSFWRYRPLSITHDGNRIKLDSLVFANIGRMAKYATLAEDSSTTDGRYESLLIRHRNKLKLLASFLRVVSGKHEFITRSEPYVFTTETPMPLQMDGEVHEFDAGAEVTVRCVRGALDIVR